MIGALRREEPAWPGPGGALILRAAEVAGCRRVLSEDLADGAMSGSVVVENPFTTGR